MSILSVKCERIEILFRDSPFSLIEIRNRVTGATICASGRQSILVRTHLELFEPTILVNVRRVRRQATGIQFVVTDRSGKYRAELHVDASGDGIRFGMSIAAPKPVWLVEWRMSGFDFDKVIVPALGGQALSRAMPIDTTLSYKYPFWLNAQFVIGMSDSGSGCWIRTKETEPRLKLLRVKKAEDGFALSVGFEADARRKSNMLDATWFLDCFTGSWKGPVDLHRSWLEKEMGLKRLADNSSMPNWAMSINFVLEMWGITKDRPEPLHTFEMMIRRLGQWSEIHPPAQTLVYLPGFAEHGIDSHAPDYTPSRDLGGPEKFKKFVDAAHEMGYRVMVHTNVLAMTYAHRLFPKFRRYQVVDPFGKAQGWGLDMDGDWLSEPYFAYINPGAKPWGDLMVKVIGKLIREYHVDAVFLDQTLLAFNESKGPNFLTGMREHILRLQRSYPDTLFVGEGLHEHIVSALPFAQIHGIDSLQEVHGVEGRKQWRRAHPVSTYLFRPYTRFVAHLLTRHPTNPSFRLQEDAYKKLGVIPALCLYDHSQEMDLPAVRTMIKRAKKLAPTSEDFSRTR